MRTGGSAPKLAGSAGEAGGVDGAAGGRLGARVRSPVEMRRAMRSVGR
jgi:hypothetical protein